MWWRYALYRALLVEPVFATFISQGFRYVDHLQPGYTEWESHCRILMANHSLILRKRNGWAIIHFSREYHLADGIIKCEYIIGADMNDAKCYFCLSLSKGSTVAIESDCTSCYLLEHSKGAAGRSSSLHLFSDISQNVKSQQDVPSPGKRIPSHLWNDLWRVNGSFCLVCSHFRSNSIYLFFYFRGMAEINHLSGDHITKLNLELQLLQQLKNCLWGGKLLKACFHFKFICLFLQ